MLPIWRLALTLVLSIFVLGSVQAASDEQSAAQAWAHRSLLQKATPHQPESALDGHALPFSFVYAGASSQVSCVVEGGRQRSSARQRQADAYDNLHRSCDGPGSRLRGHDVCRFSRRPMGARFRNCGKADTPIIEDVRPLDLGIAVPPGGPLSSIIPKGVCARRRISCPSTSRSPPMPTSIWRRTAAARRTACLPFFNLQWQGGGVVTAVGWSGQWAMRLAAPKRPPA